jgi:hypothetical protein
VAQDDSYTTPEDTALVVLAASGILTNDSDVDGDVLTTILVAGPTNGTLVLTNDGSFVYTPTNNYNGSDSFTYQADDSMTNSETATVQITVTTVNDLPVAVGDDATIAAGVPTSISVLVNDSDVDADGLTITDASTTNGTVSIIGTNLLYTASTNSHGTNVMAYVITDGNGGSATGLVTVVLVPSITVQPQSRTNVIDTTATFGVTTAGTEPLSYQWSFNGVNIVNATNATLSLPNVQTNDAGTYQLVVTNAFGSATSAVATLTVITNVAPSIIIQPRSQNAGTGTTVTFNVLATGTSPLSYQWRFNNATVAGTTNDTLLLPNVQTVQAGKYTVVITNRIGSVTSAVATLAVGPLPWILIQPTSRTILAGVSTTFSSYAFGSGSLGYQWQLNGTNIAGATRNTFTLSNAQINHAGNYIMVVSNTYGAVTSRVAVLTVNAPATITVQPQSRTNVLGTAASFSVTAAGTAPLSYQWRFNNVNITGATNATLTLTSVQTNQAGNYSVVVANSFGSAASATATFTVIATTPPTITQQPQSRANMVGTTATFTVMATGTAPLRYQWQFDGTALVGATNATLSLANVQTNDAGNYAVVVTNDYGSVTSAVATLTVGLSPTITLQPGNQTNLVGTDATFTVAATGTAPLRYQWRLNGGNIAGATNATLTLFGVQTGQAGNYTVVVSNTFGSVTSDTATLTVNTPPTITQQPQSRANVVGTTATFTVTATGTAPLRYQWQFDGTALVEATNATLSLSNLQTNDAGDYAVEVTNEYGSVTSAVATLTVGVLPTITLQPENQTNLVGTDATFTVAATGTAPLSYQWRFNNVNIAGATNATLNLTNVQTGQAGNYTVVVSNSFGPATSTTAALTVTTRPSITQQPQSRTNVVGTTATFTVTAAGTSPLRYQWQSDGTDLVNATNATLSLSNVQTNNVGNLAVMVANNFGSVTSALVTLTVVPPVIIGTSPIITLQPQGRFVLRNTTVNFTVATTGTAPLRYQWRLGGVNIVGATNATLTLTNAQPANTGAYSVVVTNDYGSAVSSTALLWVL